MKPSLKKIADLGGGGGIVVSVESVEFNISQFVVISHASSCPADDATGLENQTNGPSIKIF